MTIEQKEGGRENEEQSMWKGVAEELYRNIWLVGKLKEWIAYRHLSVSLFEWGKEKRKRR